ncbi:keratin-associated protein 4-9 isoform X5 [Hydra vulgaris]|uniref:keratin-associated protein 4-9 isoform X5 n=1 Tax=Hydra vulgaris TaxID=6087 RepID=UPI0002B4891B|nr:keratin-associated protein 4-9 isoform X1 [Hydra vulgaris]
MKIYIFMMFTLHMSQGLPPITPCFPVNCLVNPCNNYNCSIGSQCVPNYCNGCNAVCKPCVISYCKVNPCSNYRCPVGYQCVPNYCNGCFAECKKCPITICKPCTLFCPKGSKCIVRNDCGKCTYSCSKPIIPIYERRK